MVRVAYGENRGVGTAYFSFSIQRSRRMLDIHIFYFLTYFLMRYCIITGNKWLLQTHDKWGALINDYAAKGCVKDANQFPCWRRPAPAGPAMHRPRQGAPPVGSWR